MRNVPCPYANLFLLLTCIVFVFGKTLNIMLGLGTLLTGPVLVFEGAAEVRLKDGGGPCAGRVEVKHQGQWGTVCSDSWDMEDDAVVCKQLGCGFALEAPRYGYFGPGSGPIWMAYVVCHGTESALSDCRHRGWGIDYCDHRHDAGVKCSGFVQLVGGDSPCSGRVEIHDGDQRKTVCDSDLGPKAANIICRELQCGTALSIHGAAPFGEGVGPIWDRELQCAGNESFLMFCPRGSPRDQPCTHANTVGVTCTRFRLVNGSTACEGRVEVEVLGTWGTLCAPRWDLSDAHVLCRHLNCGFAESIPRGGHFGRGTGPVWKDSFHCEGTEAHLRQCPMTALGASPCSHENDAGVICSEFVALRLENSTDCSGRLQVFYNGTWGSVCSNSMTLKTVSLACKELGYGDGGFLETRRASGSMSGIAWLDRVECGERNSSFWQCPSAPWDPQSCDDLRDETHITCTEPSLQHCWARPGDSGACRHKEDAAVNCSAAPKTAAPTPRADPTRGRPTGSGRLSLPIIMCIILGALLCLLLALLAGQLRSARAGRRGSGRVWEPFSEAIYEEIRYSPAWEEQARFSGSDVPVLPEGDPADGYDDAREVSEPEEDPSPGQGDWEMPRAPEEAAGARDAPGGETERWCCWIMRCHP
ncbi:scavenger receptor cysteine-rich type 1 protein M130-like [Egretta garzetta]|uniref:scavenger receptor cysteine-rich type 1 protein M130-like n=1 Tax=Egretta garzetta TaxID=188379 RepID=UPI00163CC95D|nr:scavenger receptor cysteine-rich type 1 protein M130-like [Egretta garzetta]